MFRGIRAGLSLLVLTLIAAPAHAQGGRQNISPEERSRRQAKLDSQVTELYDVKLPPAKRELRELLTAVRDTLITARGNAERLLRAETTGSSAVVVSMARALRFDCEGTAKSVGAALEKTGEMHTSAKLGDQALTNYREAASRLKDAMTHCASTLAAGTGSPAASSAKLAAEAKAAAEAMDRYAPPTQDLLKVLEITLLPKGYIPRAGQQ